MDSISSSAIPFRKGQILLRLQDRREGLGDTRRISIEVHYTIASRAYMTLYGGL
jgi:hypothetical protein